MKTVILVILVVALLGSGAVVAVTIHRWQMDADALAAAQSENRRLETRVKVLESETLTLMNESRSLMSELEQMEAAAASAPPAGAIPPAVVENPPAVEKGSDNIAPPGAAPPAETPPGDRPRFPRRGSGDSDKVMTAEEIRAALQTGQPWERHRLIEAIDKLENKDEKLALIKEILAMTGDDHGLKRRSLQLLDKIGGTESAVIALNFLETNPGSWSARTAADILAKNADHTMTASLYAATAGESEQFKRGAVLALKRLGDPAPLNKYLENASLQLNHQDGSVRSEAVRTIAGIHDPATIPYLAQALKDTDSRTRGLAVWGLGAQKDKAALPYLEPLLQDENPQIKEVAKIAINRINNPTAPQQEVPRRLREMWER